MKLPYSLLHVNGNVLFTARGGKILSFSLSDGSHLSTWKHPDVEKVDAAVKNNAKQDAEESRVDVAAVNTEPGDNDEPPAKRQRVKETAAEASNDAPQESSIAEGSENKPVNEKQRPRGKKSKNRQNNGQFKEAKMRVPDRPVITHMTSTENGSHLLAITGHDKVIWIFEHDGNGKLTQISQRTMPKRPSSVALGPDSQIICADKFGDVYVLPFIEGTSPSTSQLSTPSMVVRSAFKPAANTTTVHSKRNLRALANQKHQIEVTTKTKNELGVGKAEGPDFDITLLLGHVSMLTSLVLGEHDGRRYILTADRDEHIRVSRYIPQAYVIEGFCFGHKEFVSTMVIPSSRGGVLVSGGGDEDVFVWDWKASKLLSRKSILSLAQAVVPELTKVAVSSIKAFVYPTETGELTYIAAICENIKAIFSWQLTEDNVLNHPSAIQLPGNPLDIEIIPGDNSNPPKIITAIDVGENVEAHVRGIAIYSLTMTDEKLAVGTTSFVNDQDTEAEELDVSEKTVRDLLYNVEQLRKQSVEEPGEGLEGEGEIQEGEAQDLAQLDAMEE